MSSSCPIIAFVVGVINGSSNFWFSIIPSGIGTPQIILLPALYSLQACPVKYPLITISTINGSHILPIVTEGSGVASIQFGTISAVAVKNFAAICDKTCPLYGIPSGKTWSNAEILSDATITNVSSFTVYTSLTFPL